MKFGQLGTFAILPPGVDLRTGKRAVRRYVASVSRLLAVAILWEVHDGLC